MEPTIMNLRHLTREVTTALELALVGLAPKRLIEELASTAGLLAALEMLPHDAEPLLAWAHQAVERAERGLAGWKAWREDKAVVA